MKTNDRRSPRVLFLLPFLLGLGSGSVFASEDSLLIDDFAVVGESALGTAWQGFTDQVMGGQSLMQAVYVPDDTGFVIRMTGEVSLENNGGFIQVRLPLSDRGIMDASGYSGIALVARGTPGPYYVHLRTRGTVMPWQYYSAPVPVSEEWQRIELPFESFSGQSIRLALGTSRLSSVAVVAGTAPFSADISIQSIEFYR